MDCCWQTCLSLQPASSNSISSSDRASLSCWSQPAATATLGSVEVRTDSQTLSASEASQCAVIKLHEPYMS